MYSREDVELALLALGEGMSKRDVFCQLDLSKMSTGI